MATLLLAKHSRLAAQGLALVGAHAAGAGPARLPRLLPLALLLAAELLTLVVVRSLSWHSADELRVIAAAQTLYAQERAAGRAEEEGGELSACLGQLRAIQNRRSGAVRSLVGEQLRFSALPALLAAAATLALMAVDGGCARSAQAALVTGSALRGWLFLGLRARGAVGRGKLVCLAALGLAAAALALCSAAQELRTAPHALRGLFAAWLAAEGVDWAASSAALRAPQLRLYALLRP